jgi:hypothetical protein
MTSFAEYIDNQALAAVELPAVHTTEYSRLGAIQATNKLQPTECKVFNEPLLYFFYGRPAYRDANQIKPTRDVGFYPVCFVIRPDVVFRKAKRLYPFDSGASQRGLYEPAVDRKDALVEFKLLATAESARRLVKGFFETGEKYLSNKSLQGLVFEPSEGKAKSYYHLINGGGNPDCDDRCSALEIQVAECMDLRRGIMAVVLPTCFLEDASLAHALLSEWRAQPLTYDAVVGMRPIEFHSTIHERICDFYRDEGLL